MTRKHLGKYRRGTWSDSYRQCLVCGRWFRAYGHRPILSNGGKP